MPFNPIFVDTSAWYAFVDKSDRDHASAVELAKKLNQPLITGNYIFDETLTLLKVRLGANVAINFGQKLWNQEVATLIRVSEKDETRAWELFIHYEDKGFSFTDCTSFALMERLEIKTVFAFDEHFLQYGKFVAI